MPNTDPNQPQTLHLGQPCSVEQSHDISSPPDALQRVELLFFLYLLITLSLGMYHTYRLARRRRRIQTLEKLFRLNVPQRAVCEDGELITAAANRVYEPIPLPISKPITDTLSAQDIPLGQGGFARDYVVSLTAGNQVVIELKSDRFDTFVSLLAADGTTVDENDDGPDGTTNSWLDVRIPKSGTYTVRVRASGDKAVGPFTLFVRRFYQRSGVQ